MQKKQSLEKLLVDYSDQYSDLVLFGPNQYQPIHRWFEIVEGFASEFVRSVIAEQDQKPLRCLDPFGGVGTTALTCQTLDIECHTFENNPFFFDVARTKLRTGYDGVVFANLISRMTELLESCQGDQEVPHFESKTFFQNGRSEKWLFDKQASNGILDIIHAFQAICDDDHKKYIGLFKLALASILINVSNVYRNGKCLSYKKGWDKKQLTRQDVHGAFLVRCNRIILADLKASPYAPVTKHNYVYCEQGDARELIHTIDDDSVDLLITSPPYLNSRDYTDIYRLELWMLGHVKTFEEERSIRKSAIRSHVQVTWEEVEHPTIVPLNNFIDHIEGDAGPNWNPNISKMVRGYFVDMQTLLELFFRKMKKDGRIYFNVANSAYGGKICPVDFIIAEIATDLGFETEEIRIARYLKSSRQQNLSEPLRESVLVLRKP